MATSFRAEGAKNIVQEFQTYGYPMWVLKLTGFFKFLFSGMLLLSIMFPDARLAEGGAAGMIFLMVVAVVSHIKVGDALTNNLAAIIMLVLSVFVMVMTLIKPHGEINIHTQCFGLGCSTACVGMVVRSFNRGDYNLDNYEKLDDNYIRVA